ncbi:MAG: Anaerobic magnesium-protoporphyrin IX monomethyl ester cyclase [Gammaproteobacteria bacterium]|nr:Anaerobic magnesium-protoporphyrin IX monomethyl ester cyclase [Gammaproteobacteria bacterium]
MKQRKGAVKKIQLVNAPNNPGSGPASAQGCFPHLGLISLGTVIRQNYPDIELEILDGSISHLEEILQKLDADIVGISVLTTTYENGLAIAYQAKERGSLVLLGNDHASRFAQTILKYRPFVDGIFVGDHTEFPFLGLIRYLHEGKGSLEAIPGLWYRDRGEIKENSVETYAKDQLPIPDRSLVDHTPYINKFNALFGNIHGYMATNTLMNIASGCIKKNSRCAYCDIYSLDLFTVSPQRAWKEIRCLYEQGFDWIWEVCDDFATFATTRTRDKPSFIEQLVASKPQEDTPRLFVYSRAQEINENIVDLYKKLNVAKVNIGMESGDDLMLVSLNKSNPHGNEDNLRAARLLADAGIQIHVSYVLGAVGETEENLENTYLLAQELVNIGNTTSMDPSVLLPLPGAPVWRLLYDVDYARKEAAKYNIEVRDITQFRSYLHTDLVDTSGLAEKWVDTFCKVDYASIEHYSKRINQLITQVGGVPGDFGVSHFGNKHL